MIRMIVAVSKNNVIGKDNTIPWHYPEDLKNFKKLTLNSTIIMGKNTYYSIGKPLPKRRNIVITKEDIPEIETYKSLEDVLNTLKYTENIWLIGGYGIYKEGLQYASEIHLTEVPDIITGDNLVYFPDISNWECIKEEKIENSELNYKIYKHA